MAKSLDEFSPVENEVTTNFKGSNIKIMRPVNDSIFVKPLESKNIIMDDEDRSKCVVEVIDAGELVRYLDNRGNIRYKVAKTGDIILTVPQAIIELESETHGKFYVMKDLDVLGVMKC